MRHTNAPIRMLLIWEVQLRIVNFNIFSSNNIILHNLSHYLVFSFPDFPPNITLQPEVVEVPSSAWLCIM